MKYRMRLPAFGLALSLTVLSIDGVAAEQFTATRLPTASRVVPVKIEI